MREPGHGGGSQRHGVGGGRHGHRQVVVQVHHLLVRVPGGDRQRDGVGEQGRRRGGREVERGEADGRDGEGRALRAVQEVEGAAGDGGHEGEEDDG